MRPPSSNLIVDTNILLSVVLGRQAVEAAPVLVAVGRLRNLIVSQDTAREGRRVTGDRRFPATTSARLEKLLKNMTVVEKSAYLAHLAGSQHFLRSRVPSKNGSVRDAHILAVAWLYDADIWSHDRDFAGTGWPSWSSINLLAALAGESAA